MEKHYCPNCGAPVTSEVCPFCNTTTGVRSKEIAPEYPVIPCKSAKLSFFKTIFPMIFAVSFGFVGFVVPFFIDKIDSEGEKVSGFIFLPFAIISVVAAFITLLFMYRYLITQWKGKECSGIVYGYVDDMVTINNVPAQKVKILINTDAGKRFILYSTGTTSRLYQINSRIELKVYKKYFLVMDKEVQCL